MRIVGDRLAARVHRHCRRLVSVLERVSVECRTCVSSRARAAAGSRARDRRGPVVVLRDLVFRDCGQPQFVHHVRAVLRPDAYHGINNSIFS